MSPHLIEGTTVYHLPASIRWETNPATAESECGVEGEVVRVDLDEHDICETCKGQADGWDDLDDEDEE